MPTYLYCIVPAGGELPPDLRAGVSIYHLLVENGDIDREFIAAYTEGWDAMPAFLADYPPARVAEITGIPESDISLAAAMIAEAGDWFDVLGGRDEPE